MKVAPEPPALPQGREKVFFPTLRLWSAVYKPDDTGKRRSWAFGESEWPGSDDGADNTTASERGAILPPCVNGNEDSMSAERLGTCEIESRSDKTHCLVRRNSRWTEDLAHCTIRCIGAMCSGKPG
jgi:hypothetical protein